MTQVITRYFESVSRARVAERELRLRGLSRRIIRVYTSADGLAEVLKAAQVAPATAMAYEQRMSGPGGAVLRVDASYKPLGVATITREVLAGMRSADLGGLPEEAYVVDAPPRSSRSIRADHPLILSREPDPDRTSFHMADWPLPLISRAKPFRGSVIKPHGRAANWPIPLVVRHRPRDEFAFPRHARMANLIFPLTIRRVPSDNFVFPRHARMANWPIPLTNRATPFRRSIFAPHARMANWPFPHLINGRTGTNALMPGAPRMANRPYRLLSDRKPLDRFAFPRHARMADLILPLVNRRKPITASLIPKHGRMANLILPLVVRWAPTRRGLLGLPTLSRR
ncbi:MAG: PucR family transcriptional regulator [Pseudomonadota bacterium]